MESFVVEGVKVQIRPVHYGDDSWGFELRYWIFRPTVATTYFQFRETFPTKDKMMEFARRAAPKHFRENYDAILKRLAAA